MISKEEYLEQAKKIMKEGLTVEDVEWLADRLEKADRYDALKKIA